MIELPESYVLSDQISESLKGKVVKNIKLIHIRTITPGIVEIQNIIRIDSWEKP